MFEKYNEMFDLYLKMCKAIYDSNNPYSNLDECIHRCEVCMWELVGMVQLMEKMREITWEEWNKETNRIFDEFSTVKLYNAYRVNGEIMVYA